MTLAELAAAAFARLSDIDPKRWDSDAKKLFEMEAAQDGHDPDLIQEAWEKALEHTKDALPKMWVQYEKSHGRKVAYPKIPWANVKFRGGSENGDAYMLEFSIDGKNITIDCDDVQIWNPEYIVRKMQLYARKMIDCPYLTKSGKQNWLPGAVFPWLESMDMKHDSRETQADTIRDIIREYGSKPIWKEKYSNALLQFKDAVRDGNEIFMPVSGLYAYAKKHTRSLVSNRFIAMVCIGMGAKREKKGKGNNQFLVIRNEDLLGEDYEHPQNVSAGVGKDDEDFGGSKGDAFSAWESASLGVREGEREGNTSEDGLAPGGPAGQATDLNDPF